METIYPKDLGGALIDLLKLLPKKGTDCKMHFSESPTCFSQLAGRMINSLPVNELSMSAIFSQANPCSHQSLHWPVTGIDEKQF